MFRYHLHTNRTNLLDHPPEMEQVVAAYDATLAQLREIERDNREGDELLIGLEGGA